MCDFDTLWRELEAFSAPIEVGVLGRTILRREIPILTLGKGRRAVLYVGAQCGDESLTARLLLDFVADYRSCLERGTMQYTYPMTRLFEERRILVVPMLNPDGVTYALHGVGENNPLRERVLAANGGAEFSHWRANARGAELCYNYNAGFTSESGKHGEYPESEPEVAALCRFLRARHSEILGVLDLHLWGEEIRCSCADNLTAKTMSVGRALSRATGYRLVDPSTQTAAGRLGDWCIRALGRPAFELHCGREQTKHAAAPAALLYAGVRRALFTFPFLV